LKTRLMMINKWLVMLLLVAVILVQFLLTAYHTERMSVLEEKLEEYQGENLTLKEDKRHIQEKFLEVVEEIDDLEEEKTEEDKDDEDEEENSRGETAGEKKTAYLTFDDGPGELTLDILEILREHRVPATFFVNGEDTPYGHYLYRRKIAEGHALGNHTYSHQYQRIYSGVESFMEDLLKLEELLYRTTGTRPEIMRFPGGSNNMVSRSVAGRDVMGETIREVLHRDYQYFDWNVYGFDGTLPVPSSSEIARAVLTQARLEDDLYILLHDNDFNHSTVDALSEIIEGLEEMGYTFEILTPETPPYQFQ